MGYLLGHTGWEDSEYVRYSESFWFSWSVSICVCVCVLGEKVFKVCLQSSSLVQSSLQATILQRLGFYLGGLARWQLHFIEFGPCHAG